MRDLRPTCVQLFMICSYDIYIYLLIFCYILFIFDSSHYQMLLQLCPSSTSQPVAKDHKMLCGVI